MHVIVVTFESVYFSWVEIEVVFCGALMVDALLYFGVQGGLEVFGHFGICNGGYFIIINPVIKGWFLTNLF